MLHIISNSEHSLAMQNCFAVATSADDIILIEAAVESLLKPQMTFPCKTYALASDIDARGIRSRVTESISIINENEFVKLCVKHSNIKSWF